MRAVFRMFRQIHPRHRQGTCDRLQLILLNARPRPERRLQRPGVSTGDRAPANGVQERAQPLRVIPAGLRDLGKPGRRDNLAARLDLPDKGHFLAQGVVADARQLHKCPARQPARRQLIHRLPTAIHAGHNPLRAAHAHQLPCLGHFQRRALHPCPPFAPRSSPQETRYRPTGIAPCRELFASRMGGADLGRSGSPAIMTQAQQQRSLMVDACSAMAAF